MKKIVVYLSIFSLILASLPLPVVAQTTIVSSEDTATSSSSIILTPLNATGPTITITPNKTATPSSTSPFNDSFIDASVVQDNSSSGPDTTSVQPVFDTISTNSTANFNQNIQTKWSIMLGNKHDFKGSEKYQINVNNISPQNLNAEVFDSKGDKISVSLNETQTTNGTSISILPPKNFKPGKYTLKLTDSNGIVQTQDFTWGVLAINTNKATYLPNEKADLAMAVLDDNGNMVCDADASLTITDPSNHQTVLSTSNGLIVINPDCKIHAYTENPDYQSSYKVNGVGRYDMTLVATDANGTKTISDSFQVQNSVPFDVTRTTGTRIFPPDTYPVKLNVKFNQDFKGEIVDYVPNSFTIYASTDSAMPKFDVKQIATPVKNQNGTYTALQINLPFSGTHTETLGFGQHLLDPLERDYYAKYGLAGHDGLDFSMPIGTSVLAADDGTVVMAGGQIYGTTIVIQHSWGKSYYGHLSKVNVELGQTISKGQEIGLSGNSGITTGAHLHFGIKLNSNDPSNGYFGKIDPSPYLGITNFEQNTASTINDTVKAIVWKVDSKAGDTLNLSYGFKSPNVSPAFYTLGPLSFIQNNQTVFQEARVWQLAIDLATTLYTSATASSKITTTTSWQYVTSAPASVNTTTIVSHDQRTAGYMQWQPGVTNSTTFGTTAPTSPDGKGWIYDTPANTTIASGTWAFHVESQASVALGSTDLATICVWKVTVGSGAITGSTSIIACTDGATNRTAATSIIDETISISSVAAVSFTESDYLYVEYWAHQTTTAGGKSTTSNITLRTNIGTNSEVVTPSSANQSPAIPTQNSPTNGATGVSITPTFLMTSASDAESNNLQYKVTIYSDACTTAVQTNDQSSSQTGWTGQNATCSSGSDCYTPGTQASYLTQSALSNNVTYYWRASVKDPLGLNSFVNSSTCNSFTTAGLGPTLSQLLRHGEWFNGSGVRQPFTF